MKRIKRKRTRMFKDRKYLLLRITEQFTHRPANLKIHLLNISECLLELSKVKKLSLNFKRKYKILPV